MYGSTEWLCLPDDHVDKIAACVVAAELHAEYYDNLDENLRREIEAGRLAHKRIDDADYTAEVEAHKTYARSLQTNVAPFTARRQAQLDAAKPMPGDYQGRSGGGEGA
ncbi:hypothetical protein [Aeromicrobium sp. CTD01-1L150]|uniref:hypothetical protein n=1 Tax=Aeromicrobium sp. CTD01-1L150 TaxID=3341830 RepID=UPI0035C21252